MCLLDASLAELVKKRRHHHAKRRCATPKTRKRARLGAGGTMARLDELFRYLKEPRGLRPPPRGRPRAAHPRARRARAGRGLAGARPRRAARAAARDRHATSSGTSTTRTRRPRLRLRPRGRGALPRQLLRQENGAGAVFRIIPEKIVPLEELNLPQGDREPRPPAAGARAGHRPDRLGQVDDARRDHRPASTRPTRKHIVTIEDPVEFVHTEQAVGLLAARGRRRHRELRRRRCAPPSARTPT